jgi:hypothetical protein
LPQRWFDTFLAWRFLTNRPNPPDAGLSAALHQLGLAALAPAVKKELQQKIVKLDFDEEYPADRRMIIDYCLSDCDGASALYDSVSGRVESELMAHWVEYLKAVARMELRGIPTIRLALIADVNRTWPIYEGESFRRDRFFAWCRHVGVDWPRKISRTTSKPYYPLDDDTMEDMEGRHPFIAQIRQVRKTLAKFGSRTLVVDFETQRHYFSTFVFRSVTGRNQPKNFIFCGPKWLRMLIAPDSPDHVLVYVDFIAEELGIAAGLSQDPAMRAIYEASDCHMAFAVLAGAATSHATKKTHGELRKRFKTANLAVLYGQSAFGLALRLGIPVREAELLLESHRASFPVFWNWSERIVQGSLDRGWIVTPCGWRCRVPPLSNERTWMNWPMQSTGSDLMRLVVTYLDRQNVQVLAPVHDGFLLSCRRDQISDLREAVDYACSAAVEHVLPGFPLRWEITIHSEGRFVDEEGLPLWKRLQKILKETSCDTKRN